MGADSVKHSNHYSFKFQFFVHKVEEKIETFFKHVNNWLRHKVDLVQQSRPFCVGNIDKLVHSNKTDIQSRKASPLPLYKTLPPQQYKRSCGARVLQQIAYELGIHSLPKNKFYGFNGQSILNNSSEGAIYGISADLVDDNGQLRQSIFGNLNNGSDSNGTGIVRATRLLGLNGQIYITPEALKYYKKHDPEGIKKINNLYKVQTKPLQLSQNSRYLVQVCNYSTKKNSSNQDSRIQPRLLNHFIMKRPDGTCYDPASGKSYASLAAYYKVTGFQTSGIQIEITR